MKHIPVLFAFALVAWSQAPKPGVIVGSGTGGGGGGSGTVTSVATGCGLSGGTITATGTIVSRRVANAQTGTTYTLDATDCGKTVTLSNAGAITLTVPAAGGSFVDGWFVDVLNIGAGTATCSGATCTLTTGQSARFVSDGTTWRVLLGGAGAGGTYTAGTGLSLAGNEFSINSAVTQTKANDQSGVDKWCLGSGTAGAQTCTLGTTLTAYTTGMVINYSPGTTNTTTQTLDIDTLGVKSILNASAGALAAGDLTAGRWYPLLYDGTQWRLTGSAGGGGATTKTTEINFQATQINSGGNASIGPDFTVAGTGYTLPTFQQVALPARGNMVLFLNAGTPYGIVLQTFLPSTWDSGGTTKLKFYANTGSTTGNRTYDVGTACVSPTETVDGTLTFSTVQSVTTNMSSASLLYVSEITLDATSLTGCDAGDLIYFRISRPDAVAGETRLRNVVLQFTETL